ncbi:RNA polymerase II elongation factor [Nesidiocoris tenuis]|uniref:RNA polymerase II elongation factor n=1 Tax=Nesidiocoris tenuis TaxID=355587 RepID=A0ABN7APK2_9HEMI|nr:RNA polymerase II elongation factor [Nesidiocoris tenuis]
MIRRSFIRPMVNKCSQSPTIQFLGNEGQFSLPSARSAGAKFKFHLSSNADMEGPQGSFECIQHNGQNRCLESVGSLPCKMRVQANEDVYATTKSRMQAAEKQQKENCTREIELDKAIGRRVKSRTKPTTGRRVIPSCNPANQGATLPSSGHTPPVLGHTRPQGNNHAQKPGNPELMKRPIRERIIHLLALRPYKKPELFLALSRDGLSAKDRSNLTNSITSVASCRDNSYHLLRHIWNDVQDDWPFYSEQDRVVLKRRKPENLTPPTSSDGSSPNSGTPGSPPSAAEPLPNGAKRPGYVDGADGLPTKRQRISHYKKPCSGPPIAGGGGFGPPAGGGNAANGTNGNYYQLSSGFVSSTTTPQAAPQLPAHHNHNSHHNHHSHLLASRGAMPHPSPPTPPEEPPPVTSQAPSPPATYSPPSSTTPFALGHLQNDVPKFMLEFTPIKDSVQRRRYKDEFNANYKEYRQLHALVDQVSKRFSHLDQRLKKEERGSAEWQRIKDQILKEYEDNKRNTKHQDAKRRFHYLHEKLSHIKQLVLDYDSKNS